jgi:hypothetical protein
LLRHDRTQQSLPLGQRSGSHVIAVEPQHFERVEHWRTAAPRQIVELWPAVLIQAYDFPIEHRFAIELYVNGRGKFGEPLVHIPAARDQARLSSPTSASARNPSTFNSNTSRMFVGAAGVNGGIGNPISV